MVTTTLGTLAIIEGNEAAKLLAAVALPLAPRFESIATRVCLSVVAAIVLFLGESSFTVALPLALWLARLNGAGATAILALTAIKLLAFHFQSLSDLSEVSVHVGSLVFLSLPALTAAVILGRDIGLRATAAFIISSLAVLLCVNLGGARWITYETFTSPTFRAVLVLLPIAGVIPFLRLSVDDSSRRLVVWLGPGCLLGLIIALLLPTRPISSIVFDESHGRWETVLASFGPSDFGRAANYTYSLLLHHAARLVGTASAFETEDMPLPQTDAAFVLKMPSEALSLEFSNRLEAWIRGGGRLIVVADHTDLFDSTQNLNAFLRRFGVMIGTNAVFDARGLPNVPTTSWVDFAFGKINATGEPWAWQTGASVSLLPMHSVELASYGLSFSEPGDYSRANRFGKFMPRVSLRFGNHTSVAGLTVGSGAVVAVLDSTPWSNFSFFAGQYKALFNSIVNALTHQASLKVWGWSVLALAAFACVVAVWRHPLALVAGGLTLGLVIGSASRVGFSSFDPPVEGRDYGLKVVIGGSVRTEFLKQLIAPGERSFARIISAMAKYDLNPSSSRPGLEITELSASSRWLLVQPDVRQLPSAQHVISHLERGGDLTVLFSPEQAASPEIRAWIEGLGLVTQRSIGLSVGEDSRPGGILNRRGAMLLRDIRTITVAKQTSRLKERASDALMQSYTVRPTRFPRTSGLFNVGFSSDQFSDDSVGDIWEGTSPSALGKLREQQLAAALLGKDVDDPMPRDIFQQQSNEQHPHLPEYIMLVDGKTAVKGTFQDETRSPSTPHQSLLHFPTLNEDPVGYLKELRNRSLSFVKAACPRKAKITQCESRLIGPDMMEWMVSWASSDDEDMIAVELLHERRFSGLGQTVNVVFAN
ncbi:hypothetical protein J6524_25125 [Bradyrhizobium sp. WSM 1738]|uniref:hypothetical protein n=1 Tax=Bradyrhizobium hereditatis TaxID=2821405 RepID=UPI001CE36F62|nr:hypothetical protein [Bradyrhizobium hereditatis]MCA6118134.1 hypothetical protein [Bradyrhizobium hereditatis]